MKKTNPVLVTYKTAKIFELVLAVLAGIYAVLAAVVAVMSCFDDSGTRAVLVYALSCIGATGLRVWFSLQAYSAQCSYKDHKKALEIEEPAKKTIGFNTEAEQ